MQRVIGLMHFVGTHFLRRFSLRILYLFQSGRRRVFTRASPKLALYFTTEDIAMGWLLMFVAFALIVYLSVAMFAPEKF